MRQSSSSYQMPHHDVPPPHVHVQDFSSGHGMYERPRSPSTSPDSGRNNLRDPSLKPPSARAGSSASSISSEYRIVVEPPVRPPVNTSCMFLWMLTRPLSSHVLNQICREQRLCHLPVHI